MYTHLHLHSPYSFLDGATELEALVRAAAWSGMQALALTDHDNLCAAVKFSQACGAYHLRPILGAELTMEDDTHLTLLARNRDGYAALGRLLTLSHALGGRLNPHLPWAALGRDGGAFGVDLSDIFCLSGCRRGLVPALVRRHAYPEAEAAARRLLDAFGPRRLYLELQDDLTPDSWRVCRELVSLARHIGVEVVATNNVHYAAPEGMVAHDLLRCVAAGVTTAQRHPARPLNSERYLKSAAEMEQLFAWCPQAVLNTRVIAEQCEPALPREEDVTPRYPVKPGHDAASYLRHLVMKGAKARYRGIPPEVAARLEHELEIICTLGYADYFLMVWEIVRWARRSGIRCTGRGSAADSCVAYALYLTDVDVIARRLPFARFLAPGKTPDIDVDFPSDRRDEVFRYILGKYGEEHVAMVCTFHTFWAKSAVRDVGKALGVPPEVLALLSNRLNGFVRASELESAFERFPELRPHAALKERFQLLFDLCGRVAGFPRHIGTHSSGVVISREPLARIAPLQPSARGLTQIWTLDKDDAEAVGAIKFDVLSLRALSAVADAEADIERREERGERREGGRFDYDRIPLDDPETYRMMQAGASVGTFQFESAAQLALHVTMEPRHFEDLVAAVALIRPGPIRGNVVSRFVACRNGWARADVLHPALEPVLAKTYGCIVFQEQVNDVVAALTGCGDAEADRFRKSLTRHTRLGTLDEARVDFARRVLAYRQDVTLDQLNRIFDQIEGWGGYGFTEGHAASFALTGYKTAYLSRHYAAEYYAGLMNHQPMGFYNANSLAAEARHRGVTVLPVEINRSTDKSRTEGEEAIRLGLRLVADLRESEIAAVEEARAQGEFASLLDFCARVLVRRSALENLILCGAFDLLHEHRRGLLWRLDDTLAQAACLRASRAGGAQCALPVGSAAGMDTPVAWDVEDFEAWDKFLWTWRLTGVCAECHVFAHLRSHLERRGVMPVYEAMRQKQGTRVTLAGLNVRPHRPGTRTGNRVLFTLIEDESGLIQAGCFENATIDRCTPVLLTSPAVFVRGTVERKGKGSSLIVERVKPLSLREIVSTEPPPPVEAPPTPVFTPFAPVAAHALIEH